MNYTKTEKRILSKKHEFSEKIILISGIIFLSTSIISYVILHNKVNKILKLKQETLIIVEDRIKSTESKIANESETSVAAKREIINKLQISPDRLRYLHDDASQKMELMRMMLHQSLLFKHIVFFMIGIFFILIYFKSSTYIKLIRKLQESEDNSNNIEWHN